MFFVSVASKGLRICVSGLESTLAGTSISVDSKGSYRYIFQVFLQVLILNNLVQDGSVTVLAREGDRELPRRK